jgi:hypothetical protein
MTKAQCKKLKEHIARGINHGLDNSEIYQTINCINSSPADLIGVIRSLMEDRKDYFENRIGD